MADSQQSHFSAIFVIICDEGSYLSIYVTNSECAHLLEYSHSKKRSGRRKGTLEYIDKTDLHLKIIPTCSLHNSTGVCRNEMEYSNFPL